MENKVIYQIYPKSFKDTNNDGIGDIKGIIEKFDYIRNLGVDYIWLTPILCSPQNDNGYDISDYYQIDNIFGTLEDYQELIMLAKQHNIKIMFDLVLNHISTEHHWFKRAISGDEEYQKYFIWSDSPNELMSGFGKSAWTYVDSVGKYYLHLFDDTQADLNWHNPKVRTELYKMVNYWIDLGVEGFRLDVIDLIAKEPEKLITSRGPKFVEYLEELVSNTFKDKCLTVGECWNFGPEDTADITGDHGLTQAFHFSHLDWVFPKWGTPKISSQKLAEIINKWQNNSNVIEALVLNNHDLPRLQSYWYGQSNNELDNYFKATMLFAINLLSKGNTYIYQGEEIGMENAYEFELDDYDDIESINQIHTMRSEGISDLDILNLLHCVSRDNARTPMHWDNTENFGFSQAKPWIKLSNSPQSVQKDINSDFSIYKKYVEMITWKKNNYANFTGELIAVATGEYLKIENDNFILKINLGSDLLSIEKNEHIKIELSNYKEDSNDLRPYEFKIYKQDKHTMNCELNPIK